MTVAIALTVNIVLVVALLGALAYMMGIPRKLASGPLPATPVQAQARRQRRARARRSLVAIRA
jgi:hypothetical protein